MKKIVLAGGIGSCLSPPIIYLFYLCTDAGRHQGDSYYICPTGWKSWQKP